MSFNLKSSIHLVIHYTLIVVSHSVQKKYRFHAVHQDLPRSSLCLRNLTIAIRVAEASAREPAKYIAGL
jgi:hypothetical protein